jgi:murein DD-endopeptidase MepM/ murein hydrolase activator NlpD
MVTPGGSGVVLYDVGDTSVRDGVAVGSLVFPGNPLPGGAPGQRFALFGLPYDVTDRSALSLFAEDEVGNRAAVPLADKMTPRAFPSETIVVRDDFLAKVVPEILSHSPEVKSGADALQSFLAINRDLRRANAAALGELAGSSAPQFLWSKAFLPLPRAKVMSAFADRRTYVYAGREVDQQTHLGFDLAATRNTPVPAGNDGKVALAGYFGIYGNAVVLDHGYGLMSLYAHLSQIEVAKGQSVARGDTLGKTGATGLAGGDHLHFTLLIHGLPVNPNEWWDPHWIRDRVVAPLGGALNFTE